MIVWLVVVGSAFWVLVDANSIGVRKGLVSGMGDMGPWGWFFATLLLWIIGFPMYLSYRGKFKQALAANQPTLPSTDGPANDISVQIERLASLRDKGLLNQQEFEAKKRQLLGI